MKHGARLKPRLLVFGEDEHDRKALQQLVEGLRPSFKGCVEVRRRPLVLIKNTEAKKASKNATEIGKVAKQEAALHRIVAVVAHEDCDALEPAHEHVGAKIEAALNAAGSPGTPVAATPAWELETWWMVFPEAVRRVVPTWREPSDWLGKNVGSVANSKEALKRAVRAKGAREYEERDSIAIARAIVELGLLSSFDRGRRRTAGKGAAERLTFCASFERFRAKVLALAE